MNTEPINLADDFDDPAVTVTMYGHTFIVPLWDAHDELAIIDRRHAADAPLTFPDGTTRSSPLFLDSVIDLLKRRFGLERCSREGAWRFYRFITGKVKELQAALAEKKSASETTPESPTGMESTAADSASSNEELGSNASTDSTPSETCVSPT